MGKSFANAFIKLSGYITKRCLVSEYLLYIYQFFTRKNCNIFQCYRRRCKGNNFREGRFYSSSAYTQDDIKILKIIHLFIDYRVAFTTNIMIMISCYVLCSSKSIVSSQDRKSTR